MGSERQEGGHIKYNLNTTSILNVKGGFWWAVGKGVTLTQFLQDPCNCYGWGRWGGSECQGKNRGKNLQLVGPLCSCQKYTNKVEIADLQKIGFILIYCYGCDILRKKPALL